MANIQQLSNLSGSQEERQQSYFSSDDSDDSSNFEGEEEEKSGDNRSESNSLTPLGVHKIAYDASKSACYLMDKKPQTNKLTQTEGLYEIQSDNDEMLIPLNKSHSISRTLKKSRRIIQPPKKKKSSSSAKKVGMGAIKKRKCGKIKPSSVQRKLILGKRKKSKKSKTKSQV